MKNSTQITVKGIGFLFILGMAIGGSAAAQDLVYDLENISVLKRNAQVKSETAKKAEATKKDAQTNLSDAAAKLQALEAESSALPEKIRSLEAEEKIIQNLQRSKTQQASTKKTQAQKLEPRLQRSKHKLTKLYKEIEVYDAQTATVQNQKARAKSSLSPLKQRQAKFRQAAAKIQGLRSEIESGRQSLKEIQRKYGLGPNQAANKHIAAEINKLNKSISQLDKSLKADTAKAKTELDAAKRKTQQASTAANNARSNYAAVQREYGQAKKNSDRLNAKSVSSIQASINSLNQQVAAEAQKQKSLSNSLQRYINEVRTPAWNKANAKANEVAKVEAERKALIERRRNADPKDRPAISKLISAKAKELSATKKQERDLERNAKAADRERDKRLRELKSQEKKLASTKASAAPQIKTLEAEKKALPGLLKQAAKVLQAAGRKGAKLKAELDSANANLAKTTKLQNTKQVAFDKAGAQTKAKLVQEKKKKSNLQRDLDKASKSTDRIQQAQNGVKSAIVQATGKALSPEEFENRRATLNQKSKELETRLAVLEAELNSRANKRSDLAESYKQSSQNLQVIQAQYSNLLEESAKLEEQAARAGKKYAQIARQVGALLARKDVLVGELAQFKTYYKELDVYAEQTRAHAIAAKRQSEKAKNLLARAQDLFERVLEAAKADAKQKAVELAVESLGDQALQDAGRVGADEGTRLGKALARRQSYRSTFDSAKASGLQRGVKQGKRDGQAIALGMLVGYRDTFSAADNDQNEQFGKKLGVGAGEQKAKTDLHNISGKEAKDEQIRQWQKELEKIDLKLAALFPTSIKSMNDVLANGYDYSSDRAKQAASAGGTPEDNAENPLTKVFEQTAEEDPYADKNIPGVLALNVSGMPDRGYPQPQNIDVASPVPPAANYGLGQINETYKKIFVETFAETYNRLYLDGNPAHGSKGYSQVYSQLFLDAKLKAQKDEASTGLADVKAAAEKNGDLFGYQKTYAAASHEVASEITAKYEKLIKEQKQISIEPSLVDAVDPDVSADQIAKGAPVLASVGTAAGKKAAQDRGYKQGEPLGYKSTYTLDAIENAKNAGAQKVKTDFANNAKIKPIRSNVSEPEKKVKPGETIALDLVIGNFGEVSSKTGFLVVTAKAISGVKLAGTNAAGIKEIKLPSIPALSAAKVLGVIEGKVKGGSDLEVEFEVFDKSPQGYSYGIVRAKAEMESTLEADGFFDKNYANNQAFAGAKTFYSQYYNSENVVCISNGTNKRQQFEYRVTTTHPRLGTEGRWRNAGLGAVQTGQNKRCFAYAMKAVTREKTDFKATLNVEIRDPSSKEVVFENAYLIDIDILSFE